MLSAHYCHDNLVSVSFFENVSCSGGEDDCSDKGCCDTEVDVYEISNFQKLNEFQKFDFSPSIIAALISFSDILESTDDDKIHIIDKEGPPLVRRIYLNNSSLVFYG